MQISENFIEIDCQTLKNCLSNSIDRVEEPDVLRALYFTYIANSAIPQHLIYSGSSCLRAFFLSF